MRVPLLAGNWKMHKTVRESLTLVEDLDRVLGRILDRDVVVCPPFTALNAVGNFLKGKTIRLGAQDLFWEEKGAFTGGISPVMLTDVGCQYVIIGHSERRKYFSETDTEVNRKVKIAISFGLVPIICVGESLEQREAGVTGRIVRDQVRKAVEGLTPTQVARIIIAYEPIWAIGTGKTDTPEEANETIVKIREELAEGFGYEASEKIRGLYGGSVNPKNIDGFMAQKEIDGALVGGASLDATSFARIVRFETAVAS